MIITAETTFDRFRIRFDGLIQMSIKRNIASFQSWFDGKKYHVIEIQVDGNNAIYEYDSEEKWKKVIALMEEHKII